MRLSLILFFITNFVVAQNNNLPEGNITTDRTKTNINIGWKFHLGAVKGNPESKNFKDSSWKNVSIPHTTQLVSYEMDSIKETWIQPNYLRDFGWYRKQVFVDKSQANKKIILEFEGVHNATELWVNGKSVGDFKINGYVPFHFDITDFVKLGKDNLIVIKADNSYSQSIAPDPHRTDYVKFGGLYRDLYLVTKNKLHVTYNWENFDAGVHITTPTINDKNGTVSIKTSIKNENSTTKNAKIVTKIINADGYVLQTLVKETKIGAGQSHTFRQTTTIEDDFNKWSPNNPYLYRVYSVIYEEDRPVDFVENKFGFRSFQLVEGKGFVLNGEPLFLVGVNRHQNYPNIGDAVPNSFHYNEALQYKKAGINIIRLSHYTQDDSFLNACDELGIIVYEEVSTWIEWGDRLWFDKLENATRRMIRNHRNHPSIVFWGAGINHRGPVPRMQQVAKEEDPFRFTASASAPWNGVKNQGVTDIHATMDYRRSEFPESAFTMVMEHGSRPNAEQNQFHISRYKASKQNIAAIAWLGADYNHLQPDIDDEQWKRTFMTTNGVLSGYRIPKPVYYWYQSELVTTPMVHIADETASTNGKVRVYSNCQEVELYQNGKLIAKQKPDNSPEKVNLNHPSFTFHYNWKDGELKAIGYSNNAKIVVHSRTKQSQPNQLKLDFNITEQPFFAGGSDIRLVHASIVDKNGEIITDAKNKVTFSISGEGEIIDNGKVDANPALPHYGVASIYIKGTQNAGQIIVTATSKGLQSASKTIETTIFNTDEIANNATVIYDYPTVNVDIGGDKQLVQFDWQEWTNSSTYKIKEYDATVFVSSNSDIKWLGNQTAMLGDLSFMGTDGLYVENDKLTLKIDDLKAGKYALETFHHSRKGKMTNKIQVTIADENGEFVKIADDHIVDYHINNNTGERKPLAIKTMIVSNGKDPIMLHFKKEDKKDAIWLNGFTFSKK